MVDPRYTESSCDIFCTVVDNYGDIGVCWRLARQLANEQGLQVRLWVDDLRSFGKLCPELDVGLEVQTCRGVEVRWWVQSELSGTQQVFPHPERVLSGLLPHTTTAYPLRVQSLSRWEREACADLVIEAFACKLPQSYIEAMAAREHKPVWVNLEYLSAEEWVEGCHKLPSPHPTLPLNKYFFFPGFTEKTGGLLLERGLLVRRDVFQAEIAQEDSLTPALSQGERGYWVRLGVSPRVAGELRVSLFGYENEAMGALLSEWEHGSQFVTCLLPEGRALPQAAAYFGVTSGLAGEVWQRGNLRVIVLP
ncbi:MAG: elongation factor P maturation arginine rhamnosyltransferase EarP, partial [Gallionella sp.]|nr:elongation factor P maturation arginine rhamnosyltransferase EarP [Gallionella sp.]